MTRSLLAALLVLGCSGPALAEVWAYVDPSGTAHFARQQVDERYVLYFKGGSSLDPAPPPEPAAEAELDALRATRIYAQVAQSPNRTRFDRAIERHAKAQKLDPALVRALIAVESAFDPDGVSVKGAVGLMQVMPETGMRYGLAPDAKRSVEQRLRDPETNLRIGTRYLHDLLGLFSGDLVLALAAYNAGEGAVARYANSVPPFPETQEYVRRVRAFHRLYLPPPATPAAVPAPRLTLDIGRARANR